MKLICSLHHLLVAMILSIRMTKSLMNLISSIYNCLCCQPEWRKSLMKFICSFHHLLVAIIVSAKKSPSDSELGGLRFSKRDLKKWDTHSDLIARTNIKKPKQFFWSDKPFSPNLESHHTLKTFASFTCRYNITDSHFRKSLDMYK